MDNHFFRQCFPHYIECTDKTIRIYSQQPKLMIFEGVLPEKFNRKKLFEKIASNRPDYISETKCYLYDANENPVSNMDAYDAELMVVYQKRLDVLLDAMRVIELKQVKS